LSRVPVSWNDLENLNPDLFVSSRPEDFHPQDMINMYEYDSDDEKLENSFRAVQTYSNNINAGANPTNEYFIKTQNDIMDNISLSKSMDVKNTIKQAKDYDKMREDQKENVKIIILLFL
jgi:hypothetical protein